MLSVLGALALVSACGPAGAPGRAAVPGVDRVSGELSSVEVDLAGADLAAVRGPAGVVLLGGAIDGARVQGGSSPECALRRTPSGAVSTQGRCAALLGAYAALDRARGFLLAAGAEALVPAPVLADSRDADAGLHYVPFADAFTLAAGPAGARVPAALNPGVVVRELSRRHLRALADTHPALAEGIAQFLGAAAAGDPGYLAASEPGGDPMGQLDLSRPLPADAPASATLAGALWAWADASGDPTAAARATLNAARAIDRGASGAGAVLSLVAAQFDGAERDQACAVFRARLGASSSLSACP